MVYRGLNGIGLPTFEPKGAFYCFPKVDSLGMTDQEFSERLLLEEKVAVVPGSGFGDCGEGFVRICYASSMENLEEALLRMGRFVERYAR
jgi:aminotransferase